MVGKATKPEDLDEKYASVPAAATKLSSQLGKITDNTDVEIGKVFPNGNPEGTTLATDVSSLLRPPHGVKISPTLTLPPAHCLRQSFPVYCVDHHEGRRHTVAFQRLQAFIRSERDPARFALS